VNWKVKKSSWIILIALAASISTRAQISGTSIEPTWYQDIFSIKGVKFADALLEKWISEYSKTNPDASPSIAGKEVLEYSIEIVPLRKQKDDILQTNRVVMPFGKYAVLPIAGKDYLLPDELKRKKLNEKRLKELLFEKDILEEDYDADANKKEKYDVVVYSGNNSCSVSHVFAGHFGYETSRLKGKKIAGDDIYPKYESSLFINKKTPSIPLWKLEKRTFDFKPIIKS
jgi:hypothetical protein